MGNFDAYTIPKRDNRPVRTVLRDGVGPDAANIPEDLHIITRTLASAGLLAETASPAQTRDAIFQAIRHVRKTLPGVIAEETLSPGDDTERAVRRALARGRLPLSHRAVMESTAPRGARTVLDGGMRRARAKLLEEITCDPLASPLRRTLLPAISPETFQSNRRLCEALANGGHIDGLDSIIAASITDGGKQSFSDVRDFFQILKSQSPVLAQELYGRTRSGLKGKASRRFAKLYRSQPPVDGDFDVE